MANTLSIWKNWINAGLRRRYPRLPHSRRHRVLVWGDSNSALPDRRSCWPMLLQRMSGGRLEVINESVSGRTTGFDTRDLNSCACLKQRLRRLGPVRHICVMLGTNDVKMRYGPPRSAQSVGHLQRMVDLFADHQPDAQQVILLPPPIGSGLSDDFWKADERIRRLCTEIRRFCTRHRLDMIDTFATLNIDRHLQPDAIHLNAAGRLLVAAGVWHHLRASVAG